MTTEAADPAGRAGAEAALALVATNVAVVTTAYEGAPHGLTANVWGEAGNGGVCLVTVRRGSRSAEAIAAHGRFAANVLRVEQVDLARRFARREPTPGWRFSGVPYDEQDGCAVLPESLVTLICAVEGRFPFGEQEIFTGRITGHRVGAPGAPLLFHARSFCTTAGIPAP